MEPPAGLFADLAGDIPIALLPLRLETRFGTRPAATDDGTATAVATLRVRIYPDDISITGTDVGTSPAEASAARAFWAAQQQLDGEGQEAFDHRRMGAWEVLVQHVGAPRAVPAALAVRDGALPQEAGGAAEPAPHARLLPDAWVLVGQAGGRTVFTHYLQRAAGDLQTGPTRSSPSFDPSDALLIAPEDGLRWLSDFDAALRIGMAAEIDLETAEQAASGGHPAVVFGGLDALYVLGVLGGSAEDTAAQLSGLLSAHAGESAASFLQQGMPTNVVAGAGAKRPPAADPYAGYRWLTEPAAVPAYLSDTASALQGGATDGVVLETALGLADGATSAMPGSGGTQQWLARNMGRALFPVAFGEAIGTLSTRTDTGAEDSPAARAVRRRQQEAMIFAREHISSYVRAGGPITGLRVGRNPYGFLPVMAREGWVPQYGDAPMTASLVGLLDAVRWYFDRAARTVPRLNGSASPDTVLHNILSRAPVPHEGSYQVRDVAGLLLSYVNTVNINFGPNSPEPDLRALVEAGGALDRGLGRAALRRLVALSFGETLKRTNFEDLSLHNANTMRSWVAHTDPHRTGWESPSTYLYGLLEQSQLLHWELQVPHDRPTDLLYILAERSLALAGELDGGWLLDAVSPALVQSMVQVPPELVGSALRIEEPWTLARTLPVSQLATEAVQFPEHLMDRTATELAFTATDSLEGYLQELAPDLGAFGTINTLAGTRDAVRVLADAGRSGLDDDGYTRLVSETLSCAGTRLDAWATSLATARLDGLRTNRRLGIHVGAWGVLVDVRPQSAPEAADGGPQRWREHLADHGLTQAPELRHPRDYVGYVHAPSLSQAVTAGILRAGELAHKGDGSSVASIDLTSHRVRTALDVLAAMSHGQPLGALLGYRLERSLHHSGRHTLVATLRERFPQRRADGPAGDPEAGDDGVVPAEVVDGLQVWNARAELLASPGGADLAPFLAELDATVEAVADVMVADGVHQIATGRTESAGATFTAIAEGRIPPQVSVAAEPRSGITITHRLMVALESAPGDAGGSDAQGWKASAPRALLAPAAERWAQSILGAATSHTVELPAPAGGAPQPVSLDALALCALDVVAESVVLPGGSPALAARCTAPADLLELARAAAEVLSASRPAEPGDVWWPPETDQGADVGVVPAPPSPDPAALATIAGPIAAQLRRLKGAADAIHDAVGGPGGLAPGAVPPEAAGRTVDAALLGPLAELGIVGTTAAPAAAAPPAGAPPGEVGAAEAIAAASAAETLLADAFRLIQQGQPTTATATVQDFTAVSTVNEETWEAALENVSLSTTALATLARLTRRLGGDVVVPTLPLALAGPAVGGVAAGDLQRWLARMARIRPAMARFDDLCLFREASGRTPPDVAAFHLPPTPGLAWLGGPLAEKGEGGNPLRRWIRPGQPHTHLVLAGAAGAPQEPRHLLVLDELAEVLPAPTAATGLAVHYNAPNARAPQSVLLAVHPNPEAGWDWPLLLRTLADTMDLVRLRGVDLDDLVPTGITEFLPLSYVHDGGDGLVPLDKLTEDSLWLLHQLMANRMIEGPW
ncbi:hypothetical protein [Arthrobacter sp. 35W]|uniref:hypothetical protein n=1 Tax=Arthrobacter sp. 35W TaxID=1132441 RepID=UPI0012DD30B0|nr:hypothetical protein [Arthrobacter sp. 35W]